MDAPKDAVPALALPAGQRRKVPGSMHVQAIPDDLVALIHQLNRGYLYTARELLRSERHEMVEVLFGVDETLARWLEDAAPQAVERLATTPGTVFRPRLPQDTAKLLADCTRAPECDIAAMHLLLRNLSDGSRIEAKGRRR
jgi:hypothetical protein